jgi:hypothetical protein
MLNLIKLWITVCTSLFVLFFKVSSSSSIWDFNVVSVLQLSISICTSWTLVQQYFVVVVPPLLLIFKYNLYFLNLKCSINPSPLLRGWRNASNLGHCFGNSLCWLLALRFDDYLLHVSLKEMKGLKIYSQMFVVLLLQRRMQGKWVFTMVPVLEQWTHSCCCERTWNNQVELALLIEHFFARMSGKLA